MSRVPVYFVTFTELEGDKRELEYRSDNALQCGSHLRSRPREGAPMTAYVVQRVVRDPSGKYDALIDAEQWIAEG